MKSVRQDRKRFVEEMVDRNLPETQVLKVFGIRLWPEISVYYRQAKRKQNENHHRPTK